MDLPVLKAQGLRLRPLGLISCAQVLSICLPLGLRSFRLSPLSLISCAQVLRSGLSRSLTSTWKWRFVFSGGRAPEATAAGGQQADLLYTGHQDGRVRVWEAGGEVPVLLTAVPFDGGGQTGRLRGVTAIEVRLGFSLRTLKR